MPDTEFRSDVARVAQALTASSRSEHQPTHAAEEVAVAEGTTPPFDLGAVMEQVHFAFRRNLEGTGTLVGGHSTYGVEVDQRAFAVRPFRYLPRDEASTRDGSIGSHDVVEGEWVSFRTLALGRVENARRLVPLEPVEARIAPDGHVHWTHTDHVEHLRNGEQGVEQSWSFASAPRGRGDLVVSVAAAGLPWVGETDGGLHFANPTGLGVRYGHAVWVDGSGARTPVPATWRAGAIELRVPAAVVDGSVYPAVLDPTVGPEFGIDTPVAEPADGLPQAPHVASNGTDYFVVWGDGREFDHRRIYGTRVTAAGVVQDASGIPICTFATGAQGQPAVASNGQDYFVAWSDWRGTTPRIYGTRVTSAGVVLDLNGSLLGGSTGGAYFPAIASNGTDYFVVWEDFRNGATYDIYGARVTSAGVAQDGTGIALCTATNDQHVPTVASDGQDYLVAWYDRRSPAETGIHGARVSAAGVLQEPNGFPISVGGNGSHPSAAWNGAGYLVVWNDNRNNNMDGNSDIYGSRVSATGVVQDPMGVPISVAPDTQTSVAVVSRGVDYFVVWSDFRTGTEWNIYGSLVTSAGVVQDPAGVPILTASASLGSGAIASNGDSYFAAWVDGTDGPEFEIHGARLSLAGAVQAPGVMLISATTNSQQSPAIASNGTNYFAAWGDLREGNYYIYGARLSPEGLTLDAGGLLFSGTADYLSSPAVASNGDDYLIAWQDVRGGSTPDIYVARATSDGVVQDPNGLVVCSSANAQHYPSVASNGIDYFVVWQDARYGVNEDVFGTRVTSAGVVLAPNGSVVSGAPGAQLRPAVASSGSEYLVAWYETRTNDEIYGARVASTGVLQDASGFAISTATGHQRQPAVASNGVEYFVVWHDQRNAASGDIYGARVTPAGVVLDASGRTISNAANSQAHPAITANGSGYLVAWNDQRVGPHTQTYAVAVSSTGATQAPTSGFVVNAGPVENVRPSLASAQVGKAIVVYQRDADRTVTRAFGRVITTAQANGTACALDDECVSAECVDGVCCDTACGGGSASDCMGCSAALTGGVAGVCGFVVAATPCGSASNSSCDAPDTCNDAGVCMANWAIPGTPCGSQVSGPCSAPDSCNATGVCDARHASAGVPCGDQGVTCRIDDVCSGVGDCTDRGLAAEGTPCGDPTSNACTSPDACSVDGLCLARHAVDGTPCQAGLFCTSPDLCASGVCAEGTSATCLAMEKCNESTNVCYPACGDGTLDAGEDCDDAELNSDQVSDACRTTCELAGCGDGVIDTGEGCDDGPSGSEACVACQVVSLDIGVMSDAHVVRDASAEDASTEDASAEDADTDDASETSSDHGALLDSDVRPDLGVATPSGGGCGCVVPREPTAGEPGDLAASFAILAALVVWRRRRVRRATPSKTGEACSRDT